ncbi:MAG: 2-phosphosulfolactate phosphatase [Bacteroidia bacterium]|nr:2-phosphosulfolactate phosphatase [Bacteroidia bacterium]
MNIQTCLSPALFNLYPHQGKTVVIIDILRATSAICSAFEHGINKIIPVMTIEEAEAMQAKGYLAGGERDGVKLPQFDYGNSPYDFMTENTVGKDLVLTTTNGTKACKMAEGAANVVIGSFINMAAVAKYVSGLDNDVILFCSGWKDKFNIEDTLFAGALAEALMLQYRATTDCDSTQAAKYLYNEANSNIIQFIEKSSHRIRLRKLELERDINYCFMLNQSQTIPVLVNGEIIKLQNN